MEMPAVVACWFAVLLAVDPRWSRGIGRLSGALPQGIRWAGFAAIALPAIIIEFGAPDGWRRLVLGVSLAAGSQILFCIFHRCTQGEDDTQGAELTRWIIMALASGFALRPYIHAGLVGSGDARFYVLQLADTIHQFRAGTFEIFISQSYFALAGDFHPLRTAPYFQHFGLLLDLLSGGLFQPVALANLTIVLSAVGGAFSCYLCLARLAPQHRRLCLLLAVLYVTSPGVLALLYDGDMIASWMTLPFLPLAVYGCVVTANGGFTLRRATALTVVMAGLWWAHAPIAFWTTLAAVPFVGAGIVRTARGGWGATGVAVAVAALVFTALAGYVFISVRDLNVRFSPDQIARLQREGIMNSLQEGWGGLLSPAQADGSHLLPDLQLSVGLWACLAIALCRLRRAPPAGVLLLAAAGVFVLLLLPWPAVTGRLWAAFPAQVIAISDQWPMQRFYPILSALAPFAGLLAVRGLRRIDASATLVLVALAVGVSVYEASRFQARGFRATWPSDLSRLSLLPENAGLSAYSKAYANADSPLDSDGPVDQRLNLSVVDATTSERTLANLDFAQEAFRTRPVESRSFEATNDGFTLPGTLSVVPGHRRLIRFDFHGRQPEGSLVASGRRIYQVYPLPSSGGPLAFGAAKNNGKILSLWITGHLNDDVTLRFVPRPGTDPGAELADVETLDLKTDALPLDIRSVGPGFRVTAAFTAGWLVTPRLFIPGYQAWVDGKPAEVVRSDHGYVLVRVPAGHHSVLLRFQGSPALRFSYRAALASWLVALVVVAFIWLRVPRPQEEEDLPDLPDESVPEPAGLLPEAEWARSR